METTCERSHAFEAFYRAERIGVLRAVSFTLEDRDLATDVTDEAFARAYERWSDVAEMANRAGWTYRVAINLAHNRARRRRLERRRPLVEVGPRDLDDFADPAIGLALTKLPLEQRAVVVLRFHLDWSVDQVAEALGIAPGTVKSRLSRALKRLERLLEVDR